jgi:hypothetical protein
MLKKKKCATKKGKWAFVAGKKIKKISYRKQADLVCGEHELLYKRIGKRGAAVCPTCHAHKVEVDRRRTGLKSRAIKSKAKRCMDNLRWKR